MTAEQRLGLPPTYVQLESGHNHKMEKSTGVNFGCPSGQLLPEYAEVSGCHGSVGFQASPTPTAGPDWRRPTDGQSRERKPTLPVSQLLPA